MKRLIILSGLLMVAFAVLAVVFSVNSNAKLFVTSPNIEALASCEVSLPGMSGTGVCAGDDGECEIWTWVTGSDGIPRRENLIATCSGRAVTN